MTANDVRASEALDAHGSSAPKAGALLRRDLSGFGLGSLLCQLSARRLSGRLELAMETGSRTIFLAHGYPVFARSTQFAERLGAIGLRHGLVARDALTRALSVSRDNGTPLGRGLLEVGGVTGSGLFGLLSAQFVEQLARACGPERSRALFFEEPAPLDGIVFLRGTAMSATLWAVRSVPLAARTEVMDHLAEAGIEAEPLSGLASEWLTDLGYMGDPQDLMSAVTRLEGLRSKLMARLRSTTLSLFDASLGIPGSRAESGRLSARQAADAVTLSLILCGAVRLSDPDGLPPLEAGTVEAAGLLAALRRPTEPIPDVPPSAPLPDSLDPEWLYLTTPRHGRQAARLLVLGPVAELELGEEGLEQALTLYLTCKPSPELGPDLPSYRAVVETLSTASSSVLCRTRAEALLGAMERNASMRPAATARESGRVLASAVERDVHSAPTAEARSGASGTKGRSSVSDHAGSLAAATTSTAPPGTPSPLAGASESARTPRTGQRDADQLLERVEAFIAQERWTDIEHALASHPRKSLSPTLRVALALARQRAKEQRSHLPGTLAWTLLALIAGVAAGHFGAVDRLLHWLPPSLLP